MAKKGKKTHKKSPVKAAPVAKPGFLTVLSHNQWFWLTLVLLTAVFVFLPVLENGFTNWDDEQYVTGNAKIRSLSNLGSFFNSFALGDYIPLTLLSFALEYAAVQLDPWLYHFDNLLLHLLNISLVFFLVRAITGNLRISVLTAFLFALHPMRVESVAWVTERKGLLMGTFFLGSLLAYSQYLKDPEHKKNFIWFGLAILAFLLALLSKGTAVILPVILVGLDWLKKRDFSFRVILEKAPFFLLALGGGIVAIIAQKEVDATHMEEVFGIGERVIFAGYNFIVYLVKAVIPYEICPFYPYPDELGALHFICFGLALGLAGILVWKRASLPRNVTFGMLFFLVGIAPLLQLLPVGDAIMTDRFTYLPYLGLFFALAAGVEMVLSNEKSKVPKEVILAGLGVYLLIFGFLSNQQSKIWKHSLSLWSAVIEQYPSVWVANNNRGNAHNRNGNHQAAMLDYNNALKSRPNNPKTYNNRGDVLLKQNMYARAFDDFTKAIEIDPEFAEAWNNRGNCQSALGNYSLALEDLDKALSFNPNYGEAFANRGNVYFLMEKHSLAIEEYSKAIKVMPNSDGAYINRGNAYSTLGQWLLAIDDFNAALNLNPQSSEAWLNRGLANFNNDSPDKALVDYNEAIRLNPAYAIAYYSRSGVYYGKKDLKSALRDATRAKELGYPVAEGYLNSIQTLLSRSQQP